jgi:hypothetical protein
MTGATNYDSEAQGPRNTRRLRNAVHLVSAAMHSSRGASDSGSRKGKGDHPITHAAVGLEALALCRDGREPWCLALLHQAALLVPGSVVAVVSASPVKQLKQRVMVRLSRREAYPAKWLLLRHVAQRMTNDIPVLVFAGTRHRVSSISPPSGERCLTLISAVFVRLV